ncbi:MAG: FKBP-type peptidyl-prolyl cis-trans isomerase [Chitinophagaceae bacterium]|nr:FKBP-type peptidyl-prolyl cis-trans isomerase [Chitinophagaceae bacterium]
MSIQNKLREFMKGKVENQKQAGKAFMDENRGKPGVQELPEGIQYEVLKEGTGSRPQLRDTVKAHYKGSLLDGKEFDNSFKRGQPFSAPLTALIKGWQIALPMMNEGSHWRLWIPSHLAYGDRGAGSDIPGGATLVFEVELIQVVK